MTKPLFDTLIAKHHLDAGIATSLLVELTFRVSATPHFSWSLRVEIQCLHLLQLFTKLVPQD
ncbi:hypothetical protein [Bradyrhizobium icense]|uniref:Uncharacterized protein n=1 Tax=Bradyrhizobium icense TaxID=1274631 RepID=A0A1B1UKE1_9BRAD|nr:hypothetical protein [Bradyrhizobium icense]ANW03251.1 hypothetical protein LMTR13_27055 [Bradyrhizobium icense]